LWLGVVAMGLIVTSVGLYIGLPIFRPQVAISGIELPGGSVETRELSAESTTRGIRLEPARPQANRVLEIRNARPEDASGAIDDPAVAARLVAAAQPGPPVQAEQVAVGQSVEVRLDGKEDAAATGNVVFVGKLADRNSGFVPVMVRVGNAQERLRAEVAVKVRFQTEKEK